MHHTPRSSYIVCRELVTLIAFFFISMLQTLVWEELDWFLDFFVNVIEKRRRNLSFSGLNVGLTFSRKFNLLTIRYCEIISPPNVFGYLSNTLKSFKRAITQLYFVLFFVPFGILKSSPEKSQISNALNLKRILTLFKSSSFKISCLEDNFEKR